jgi:lipopolysaccharide export system protein LptA
VITLQGNARAWDETGSTDADTIVLDQNSGNFSAEGNVASTRKPDRKVASPSLLAEDQPLQAKAEKMQSTANNEKLRYEGHVVLWQGANRLEARAVDIDRKEKTLSARGDVVSRFLDQAPKDARARRAAPAFTIVRAPELDYSDTKRLAHYKGGVALARPGLDVHSRELRAVLQSTETGSSLERAFADGAVEIVETSKDRVRRGTGEHGEYEVSSEKVVLHGGQPVLNDSVRGTARGQRLTYFANNDRLLVDGHANQPAVSKINRR